MFDTNGFFPFDPEDGLMVKMHSLALHCGALRSERMPTFLALGSCNPDTERGEKLEVLIILRMCKIGGKVRITLFNNSLRFALQKSPTLPGRCLALEAYITSFYN